MAGILLGLFLILAVHGSSQTGRPGTWMQVCCIWIDARAPHPDVSSEARPATPCAAGKL